MARRGRHTSLDPELKRGIAWLEGQPGVKKIILGRAESCRHRYAPGTLRVMSEELAGIRLNAYSGRGVQSVVVILQQAELRTSLITEIQRRFPSAI